VSEIETKPDHSAIQKVPTMFRSGRRNSNDGAVNNTAMNDSSNSSPLEELSYLLDKLEIFVDTSMDTFLDSLIAKATATTNISNDNNQNDGRRNGLLNTLK